MAHRFRACTSIVALMLTGALSVARDPDCEDYFTVPHVPLTGSCDTPEFESNCFHTYRTTHSWEEWSEFSSPPNETLGFPLNIDLLLALGPGDYGPRTRDPVNGSYALIPQEQGSRVYPVALTDRPVLAGVVDLVTGVPLVQQVDFSLPFGGAVFRHTRTYSEVPASKYPYDVYPAEEEGDFWDWQGLNWMMSENPIFIIDAAYRDVVGPRSRVCYFIPDAHHCIPFELDPVEGEYRAPARFGARLEHDGDWQSQPTSPSLDKGQWLTRPTQYTVYLQQDSLKYVITPHYVDVVHPETPGGGPPDYISAHTHPESYTDEQARNGMPYYGLVESISDRSGNMIRMNYCRFRQSDFGEHIGDDLEDDCKPCKQNCSEKGQLKSVELVANAGTESEEVVWTLVYVHRRFDSGMYPYHWSDSDYYYQNALHAIYVYDHEVDLSEVDCLTLPGEAFLVHPPEPGDGPVIYPIDTIDEIDVLDALGRLGLGTHDDWVIEARYFYTEKHARPYTRFDPPGPGEPPQAYKDWEESCESDTQGGPRLLKATMTRRDAASSTSNVDVSLYRYTPNPGSGRTRVHLKAIYNPETVARMVEGDASVGDFEHKANKIMGYEDTTPVSVRDPLTLDLTTEALIDLANVVLIREGGSFATWDLCHDLVDNFLSSDESERLVDLADPDISKVIKRGSGDGTDGTHRVYRLLRVPEALSAVTLPGSSYAVHYLTSAWNDMIQANYHHPYWFGDYMWPSGGGIDAGEIRWISVVDDFGDYAGVPEQYQSPFAWPDQIKNRRVLELNAAGQTVRDRVWSFAIDPAGDVVWDDGITEELDYDVHGRLTEWRTKGWGSPTNPDPEHKGLIYSYEYPTGSDSPEPIAAYIREGTDPAGALPLAEYTRDADRPELVTLETKYTAASQTEEVEYEYTFAAPDIGESPTRKRIISKTSIRGATPREPGGPDFHAVIKEYFDGKGRLVWRGYGTLQSPSMPASGDEFFLDYFEYDDQGRLLVEVLDADPALPPSEVGAWDPPLPTGFSRWHPDSVAPLSYVTTYQYGAYGLERVDYPNQRRQVIKYTSEQEPSGGPWYTTQRVYRNVVTGPDGFEAMSLGDINYFKGSTVFLSKRVRWNNPAENAEPEGNEPYDVESEITPIYDSSGNVVGARKVGSGDEEIQTTVIADPCGGVTRSQGPDGTITSEVSNQRGQTERVYRGTVDDAIYWGGSGVDDDMVLVEKRYYGEGVNDAHEVVAIRSLRDKPTNQYGYATTEDSLGWITQLGHDWRMRQVWRQQQDDGGQPLAHTFAFFDRQNRSRLMATYGDSAPNGGAVDPREATSVSSFPDATSFLSATPAPLSLTEIIYDARGEVQEQRSYNTTNPTSGDYLSTKRFYDQGGRPLCVIGAGGARDVYVYDAAGREVTHRKFVGLVEVQSTETQYDADGNTIRTVVRDRTHNGTGDPLTDSNSVRSYAFYWYDASNRVVAKAMLGATSDDTGSLANTFTNDGSDYPRPSTMPSWQASPPQFVKAGLRANTEITLYEYDAAGRLVSERQPNTSVTTSKYNGLGELVLTTTNAEGSGAEKTETAYQYDKGRLVKMAAVLPGHSFPGGEVDWEEANTLQVTRIEYGADVVGLTGSKISENNTLVSKIYYPNKADGQPNTTADLTFKYYSDGTLAIRTDARGVIFTHHYNELGQRTSTEVNDSAWYTGQAYAPYGRISKVTYTYDDDNRLQTVAAFTGAAGTQVVASVRLAYDRSGNLITEWQQHGDHVATATSPRIDYDWMFSDASELNLSRLTRMTYPTRPGVVGRRFIDLHYGDDGSGLDSVLNRITRYRVDNATNIAQYEYTGTGARVTSTLGNGVVQSLYDSSAGVAGYTKMDRRGRTTDLNYVVSSITRHRYQYGYDDADNMLFTRVIQATSSTGTHDNDRSYLYIYDKLNRMITANMGSLNTANTAILTSTTPVPRLSTWSLDRLGNWTGQASPSVPGLSIWADFDGTPSTAELRTVDHSVNTDNTISGVTVNGSTTSLIYDPCGNLMSDGEFYYQYDGWGRLAQVHQIGTISLSSSGGYVSGASGDLVSRYEYDGFGRLVRRYSSASIGVSPLPGQPVPAGIRIEGYYYDGVRRIQEIFTGPQPQMAEEEEGGEELEPIEDDPIPVGEPDGWCEREYVWSTGEKYLDELIVQYDRTPAAWYSLNDESGNMMALTNSTGQVVAQYTYDAYGQVRTAEMLTNGTVPDNRVGFKSMFFDRTVAASESLGVGMARSLVVGARGVSQARNRVYHPALGRWNQRDSYASGLGVLALGAWQGGELVDIVMPSDARSQYVNGMNLFEFLGSRIPQRQDPLGLHWSDDPIRPDRLIGPGWDVGGVDTYKRTVRAAQNRRLVDAWFKTARKGADHELAIGATQLIGAALTDALYGQDGRGGNDVWKATQYQIMNRMLKKASINRTFSAGADIFEAIDGLADGDYAGAAADALQAPASITELAQDIIGREADTFKSLASRISAIGWVSAGLYSGMVEFMANDIQNWGFGVRGDALFNIWGDD